MKKRLFIAMLVVIALLAVACAAPAPVAETAPAEEAASEAEATEDVAQEAEPEYTMPENEMGLANATVADIQKLVEDAGSFYLYVDGGEAVPYDYEALNQGVVTLLKDYEFPADFYYVNASILPEEEYAVLKAALGVEEAEVAEGVATYGGLYAFENGALKNTRYDFVPSEENTKISSKVVNFIFESDLFTNDHGWELVTYEQLKEKRDSGEKFMVYVGRDTCPYCMPFANSLVTALETSPANVPVYYFYTQSFKTAINRAEDGAQEAWDAVKEDIGFQYTPSLLIFEGGEQILACDSGVGSEYFDMTDDEKQVERDRVAAELELWLLEYGLTGDVA